MQISPNIGLNIPEGNDVFDYTKFLKENLEKIDENIIAIPLSEEITATEGQAVFNLSSPYAVGAKAISVEIDGVPQELGEGFTESSSTSITLSEGVPAGSVISITNFKTPSGVNTQIAEIETQLAEIATNVKSFGAKGDGITDDTLAIQNAINSLLDKGGVVHFPAGTYMISNTINIPTNKITIRGVNSESTIIKAKSSMTKMFTIVNQIRVVISDILIHGDNKASVGLHADNVGMLWVTNVVVARCLDKGIYLEKNTWMFDFQKVYCLFNDNYGIYIGHDCAGSRMSLVVSEENGVNLRIGYTRMIHISGSTFQRFKKEGGGNLLIQGGWDITIDTCWFESPTVAVAGETYDIKLETTDPDSIGSIGHMIRLLNNSFHGIWGDTGTTTKWCILDDYTDTYMTGNYIDGSNGGYPSGKWYKNVQPENKVVAFGNQINGSIAETNGYSIWQRTDGTDTDRTFYMQDLSVEGKLMIGSVTNPTSVPNGGTINTSGVGVAIVTAIGGGTVGALLQAGTYTGQTVTLINQSGADITFGGSGSNIYPDSFVFGAGKAQKLIWNANVSLWYPY